MVKPTLEEIEQTMLLLNMKVFTKPFDVTLGAVRTNDNKSNTFNDWLFAFYHDDNGVKNGIVLSGTTDAGLYYRNNPMNPKGTAVIQHDVQHRGAFQLQDPSKNKIFRGHRGQKAFRLIKPIRLWRDANEDDYLDFNGKPELSNSATNGHYMGVKGQKVNKWSAGCWGGTVDVMDIIYSIAQVQINHGLGDKFSFALIHEKNF